MATVKSNNSESQIKNPRLTPDELVALAERMVASKDPEEVERWKKEMERGFYGEPTKFQSGRK